MKKTMGICLFAILMLLCIGGLALLYDSDTGDTGEKEREQDIAYEMESETAQPMELTESMSISEPYKYRIMVDGGILVVYEADGETVFFETSIRVEELDDVTREKVEKGIDFSDEKELYDFLESHSS